VSALTPRDATKAPPKRLSSILRETTQEMASFCSAPMELWGRHSNTCLETADALDELLASLREYVRDFGDNEDSDSRRMRVKAKAVIEKVEGWA